MADLKRLIKLIPTVSNSRFIWGTTVIMLLLSGAFAFFNPENPELFFPNALILGMCAMLFLNTLQQVEFSVLVRTSPHRKKLMTQAFPKMLFLVQLCGFAILFVTTLIASHRFPAASNRTLLATTGYYVVLTLFYFTSLSIQHKVTGKGFVVYFIAYIPGVLLLSFFPFWSDILFDNSYILLLPDTPPFLTFLAGTFGCFLTATIMAVIQHQVYPYSIRQKYLDQLK